MTDIAMFDCFFYCLHERSLIRKRKGRQKCGTAEKLFIIKSVYCFKLMTVSNWLSTFETDGPFCFYTRHKLWFHNKLSMYDYELCITKYSRVVRLFIDTYIIQNEWHFRNFFKFIEQISEWELVKKIIRSEIVFRLKRIWKFSKWRRKIKK